MKSKHNLLFFLIALPLFTPGLVEAQYLVGIPGLTGALNFNNYINALYALAISVAAIFAVIKMIIAGMKYMLSDVVTSKQDAISDIKGSLFGLAIVLFAYVILFFINPNLVDIAVDIQPANPVQPMPGAVVGGAGGVSPGGAPAGTSDLGAYFFADRGTVDGFRAKCEQPIAGSNERNLYQLVHVDTGMALKPVEVCFRPMSAAARARFDALYEVSREVRDGNTVVSSSFARDLPGAIRNFQMGHAIREITDTASIQTAQNASRVLLAVELKPSNDWVDQNNIRNIRVTCDSLRMNQANVRARHVIVRASPPNPGYVACFIPN